MKKLRTPGAMAATTVLVGGLAFLIWLFGMYCATSVTAEYAAERFIQDHGERADDLMKQDISIRMDHAAEYDARYANYSKNLLWTAMGDGLFRHWTPLTEGEGGFLPRRDGEEAVWQASAVFDAQGNLLVGSWEDYVYFEYITEEQWKAGEERLGNNARAIFDRQYLNEAGREALNSSFHFNAEALRLTGSFDGETFIPVTMEYIDGDAFWTSLTEQGSGNYTTSGIVEKYDLPWITFYENPDALPPGTETVTFYSDWFDVCYNEPSPALSYRGERYENVAALVSALGPELKNGRQNPNKFEGWKQILASMSYCYEYDGTIYCTPYYYGPGTYEDGGETLHFYLVSVVYASPWRTALGELRGFYVVTFLLGAVLTLLVLRILRRELIRPVRLVEEALRERKSLLALEPGEDWSWREGEALKQSFYLAADRGRSDQNEITRLNTALDFAKTAEENRRQMTSHIAHELKTPLAVVHSYAEGLKEHIAEDKRDKYLDVILSETERMDAMVLEMLDLSRLEAGKVKLARDTFSLAELTRSIFEKLERAAEAKELQLTFRFPEDTTITADEGRIAQVVENFATNAVKYTPVGGKIAVSIQRRWDKITFAVENSCPPLSDEALSKVWDTFYRADEARSGGGTGLGLAIAKSIIELHGGKCEAHNSHNGVYFAFTI